MARVERVSDEDALTAFRNEHLAPGRLTALAGSGSAVLVNSAVGVGKSRAIDNILDDPGVRNRFDRIVVLAALKASLHERRLLRENDPNALLLVARPQERCGSRDAEWRQHELRGTTMFAKKHLCTSCPLRRGCPWPTQYGRGLRGHQFIFGAQQLLINNPRFMLHVQVVTRAKNLLLIIDEAAAVEAPKRVTLPVPVIKQFGEAVRRSRLSAEAKAVWVDALDLLLRARTADLRQPDWFFPPPRPRDSLLIQDSGITRSAQFRFIGYELYALAKAKPGQRWREPNGDVTFIASPYLASATMIFAAGMTKQYVERQLGGVKVVAPHDRFIIQHRATRVYNLNSLLGAAANFHRNMPQILDLFAQLIMRNIAAGKRTLLVSRKHLKQSCAEFLQRRLREWGSTASIVPSDGDWNGGGLEAVPLIHYGVNGVNSFEHFDCAYCLNSYYIDERILRDAVEDAAPDDLKFPVEIKLAGNPRKRIAGAFDLNLAHTSADATIDAYFQQLEAGVVIQAVGRVRYATRPREVILFQASRIAGVEIDQEFTNLADVRAHFSLETGSQVDRRLQGQAIERLAETGATNSQIAAELGICERTIRNRRAAMREGRSV